jgi:hypothetical protein
VKHEDINCLLIILTKDLKFSGRQIWMKEWKVESGKLKMKFGDGLLWKERERGRNGDGEMVFGYCEMELGY